ncbi:MAG: AbrB/MazE/SpoVT family DNA-binding domain-containing protein [archaeon]
MDDIEITSLSESGQIHLPIEIRKGFNAKDKFAVMRIGDGIFLKKMTMPDLRQDFEKLMKESQDWATDKKLTSNDIEEAVKRSRKK